MRLALIGILYYINLTFCAPLIAAVEDSAKELRYKRQCEATPHRSLFAVSNSTDGLFTCYVIAGNCERLQIFPSYWMWNRYRTVVDEETKLLSKHGLDENAGNVCIFESILDVPIRTTTTTTTKPTTKYSICPPDYKLFERMCYNFVSVDYPDPGISPDAAQAICKRVAGGRLAQIKNPQVNSFLKSLVPTGKFYTAFGLICPQVVYDGDTRSCHWDDGTKLSYHEFIRKIDGRSADCPCHLWSGCCNFNAGRWIDCGSCDTPRHDSYLCEAPMQ